MTSGGPTPNTTPNISSTSSNSFEGFLRGWHHQQGQLLAEITAALTEDKADGRYIVDGYEAAVLIENQAKELIARALGHFEEYYEHKSRAALDNVFSLFSPTWCSSFECANLWVAGFRPGVLLKLVSDSVHDLSPHQTQAINSLKKETRVEEKNIADELARIQEKIAAPPMIHAIRNGARWSEEEQPFRPVTNEVLEQLQVLLEEVVANADTLRVTMAASVAEILTPPQGLRFLAAFLRLQQGMRSKEIERENRPGRGRSS